MPKKKKAEPIDVQVGANVRALRLAKGLSQYTVGHVLGVTYKQVQKYERGANRIGPSRLMKLAKFLDVPITRFFNDKDVGRGKGMSKEVTDLLSDEYSARLLKDFKQVRSNSVRLAVIRLVEEILRNKK